MKKRLTKSDVDKLSEEIEKKFGGVKDFLEKEGVDYIMLYDCILSDDCREGVFGINKDIVTHSDKNIVNLKKVNLALAAIKMIFADISEEVLFVLVKFLKKSDTETLRRLRKFREAMEFNEI